jgi:hypothetical protein
MSKQIMADADDEIDKIDSPGPVRLARRVFIAFVLTFMSARILAFLIMSRAVPDLYLYVRQTHVHHLNYGIFLLSVAGGYLLFGRPAARGLKAAAIVYGIGMALTFDEFGMWLHLGGSYWQRASWDALTVLLALFGLIAFAPTVRRFRPHHWVTALVLLLVLIIFVFLLAKSFRYAGRVIEPRLLQMEAAAPK